MKEHSVSGIVKLAVVAALIAGGLGLQPRPSGAAEQVDIAIISFSPYAALVHRPGKGPCP